MELESIRCFSNRIASAIFPLPVLISSINLSRTIRIGIVFKILLWEIIFYIKFFVCNSSNDNGKLIYSESVMFFYRICIFINPVLVEFDQRRICISRGFKLHIIRFENQIIYVCRYILILVLILGIGH